MFRAKIIPKTQRAKNRVREHGEVMKVLREGNPQCFNGQRAIFCESEDKHHWQGWFTFDEVDIEKLPPRPRTQQEQRVYEKWKKQVESQEKQRQLEHQKMLMQHKKKKKKK